MKKKALYFRSIFVILFFGIIFHYKGINDFPSYRHAWAQADRYALALGFLNNNLNFFKPETYVLNHQFPNWWRVPSKESITAVDFPIHDYIPAILMKVSSSKSPFIFRLYLLLYSFIGLFYLFRLSYLFTNDFYKSIFILLFAGTAPVFVYYQDSFLPTIPCLSNAMIGVYFFSKYLFSQKNKHFSYSIAFFTLAALSRTTFIIPLIAMLFLEFVSIVRKKTDYRKKIAPVLISFFILLVFFFYNTWLRKQYGSNFLNSLMPASSFEEFKTILKIVYERWATHYFSIWHYVFFFLSALIVFIKGIKKKIVKREVGIIFFFCLITLMGSLFFFVSMAKQFPDHDYYFLDAFFLPLIIISILLVAQLPRLKIKNRTIAYPVFTGLLAIPLILNAVNSQNQIRATNYWDKTATTIYNFNGADLFLDSLRIPPNAKILVLDAVAPNIPFILMNRKGYAVIIPNKENIKNALTWNYDYIVFQNEFFLSDIYSSYPEIISEIKKINTNKKISICIKRIGASSLSGFMGLNEGVLPVFSAKINFDSIANEQSWENKEYTDSIFVSSKNAGKLSGDAIYGLTYRIKNLELVLNRSRTLWLKSFFLQNDFKSCEIVVSINENGKTVYYKSYDLADILKQKNNWETIDLMFQLPVVKSRDSELSLYLWNTGKKNLFIDDFEFSLY